MRKKGNTPTPSQKEESPNNPAESDTAANKSMPLSASTNPPSSKFDFAPTATC